MLRRQRRPVVEELEPRILYSADFAPALDLTADAPEAEVRTLDTGGEFDLGTGQADAAPAAAPATDASASTSQAAGTDGGAQVEVAASPLAFERNAGQTDAQVDFLARGSGYGVWLSEGDAVLALQNDGSMHVVRLDVVGGDRAAQAIGETELGATTNYLLGGQESWHTQVQSYGAVLYDDVYAGIDLRYYGNGHQLEYDFIVEAGADASNIRLAFDVQAVGIDEHGNLVLTLDEAGHTLTFQAPVSYQDGAGGHEAVASRYVRFEDGSVGFEVGSYDAARALVIDPVLAYGTYLGGSGGEQIWNMETDAAGNVYLTGYTLSTDFPMTAGAGAQGKQDVFVTKLSADLSTRLYSTYVGGSDDENGYGIAVDNAGNAYVTGFTTSNDFPTVAALDGNRDGAQDAFVFKLNATGTALLYSTYLGGSGGRDTGYGIAVDSANNVYVAGITDSDDFPITGGALDTSCDKDEGFVTKLDASGSALIYSTFIGGNNQEAIYNIAVDAAGNAVVVGATDSDSFSVALPGAYQSAGSSGAKYDAFVAKLNASGTGLLYGSLIGGTDHDYGYGVALDGAGRIYISGETRSNNFDVTAGAMQSVRATNPDGFVAVFDPSLTGSASLVYASYIGGNGADSFWGIDVSATGRIYLAGYTTSNNLAVTADRHQAANAGGEDIYVLALDPNGAGAADRVYATYLGGASQEDAWAARYSNGKFYVAGNAASASGITTSGAYDTSFNGGFDGYVAAFAFESPPVLANAGATLTYNESSGAVAVAPTLTVSDSDSATLVQATVTITGNYNSAEDVLAFNNTNPWGITGVWTAATGTLSLSGSSSVANYQAALRSVTYQNTSEKPGTLTRTVTFIVSDASLDSTPATRQISVASINDVPVNTVPAGQTVDEDAPLVFSAANGNAISIADVDAGSSVLQITLTAANGHLTLAQTTGLSFTTGDGSNDVTMTFSGTAVNLNAALDGLRFDPNADFSGSASVQIITNDLGNSGSGGATSATSSIGITVNAVNDAPVHTVPGPQATLQNTPLLFSSTSGNAITLSDVDAGNAELLVTLSVTNGTLTLSSVTGLSTVSGNSTGSVSMSGPLTALNAALDGLQFTPSGGYSGGATLTIATSDVGNTGAGGARTDSDAVAITVSANVAPTVTTTVSPLIYAEGSAPKVLDPALVLSDPDSASLSQARLRIQGGYVAGEDELLFTDQLGISGTWDEASGTLTLTGAVSAANYQAALRTVTYVNSSENPIGTRSVAVVVNDGIADSSAALRNITLEPQNDAPILTVPAGQSMLEDGSLVFSPGTGNQIAIADVDAGSASMRLTLTAANGDLTLLQTAGLTFFSGANGGGAMSVDGSINDLNAALSALRFDPDADYAGLTSVQVQVDDLGNSGVGGPLSASRTIAIDVAPVNDAPLGSDGSVTTDEDTAYVLSMADFGFSDPRDVPAAGLLAVRMTQLPGGGTLTVNGTPVVAGSFVSAADIAAGSLVFMPFADAAGTSYATLGFQVQDSGGTASGGVDLDPTVRTLTIDVAGVNDAPFIDSPVMQSTAANVALIFSSANGNAISVQDIDANGGALSLALTVTNGTLTLGSTAGLGGLGGNGSGSVSFTAMPDAINDALEGLVFTPDAWFSGSVTLQIVADDLGNTGLPGSMQTSVDVAIDVTYVAPAVTMSGGAASYTENAPPVLIDPGLALSGGTLSGATVGITGNYVNGQDLLSYGTLPGGVSATWSASTGILTFIGTASAADYEALLRSVAFEATGDAPSTPARTIEFTVEDGIGSGSASRQMNVVAVDDAPTISSVADQSVNQGASTGTLAFTLSDPDTALGSLVVSASASNAVLVPGGSITLAGAGANRTISITPAPSQYGSSTITIDVSDGSSTTSTSFQLTVLPPNLPPVITASSFSLAENSAAGTLVGVVPATDPDVEESFNRIYFADAVSDSIVRMDLSGGSVTTIVSGLSSPGGVAVDYLGGKVYWTDSGGDAIQRANLDGSGVQSLLTGLADPVSLKIDSEGGKVYWVEVGSARIRRANLDGTGLEDLLTSADGLADPRALDLDIAGGKLYWVDDGNNTIKRANLDGSGIQTLIASGLSAPNGIALDAAGGKLYWSDSGTGKIGRANLDGSAAQAGFLSVGSGIQALAVDTVRDHVYWTDDDLLNARVRRANLDGSGITTVHVTGLPLLSDPTGIALGPATPALAYSIVSGNTGGAFSIDATSGRLSVANAAALNFEATPVFSLTVQVQDAGGAVSQQAVTVQLINVNEAPSAIALSNATVAENTNTVAGFVLGALSSTDVDAGDTFTYTIAGGADQAKFSVSGNQLILTDGVLNYEAKPSYAVQVRSTDAGGLSVLQAFTINVTNVNEPPTVSAIGPQVILEDTSTAALSFTISDPETAAGSLIVTALSSNPTLVPTANIVIGGSGSSRTVTVTPAANAYGGPVTVTVRVSDGTLLTQQTFAVAITGVADTPSVTNATTTEDTQTSSGLVILRNAQDGTEVTHYRITGITGGTLYMADGTTQIANDTYILAAEGSAGLKFTPAANSTASGSFNVQASTAPSAGGLGGGIVTATVAVTPVNDVPVAVADSFVASEDIALTIGAAGVLANDTDPDGPALSAVLLTGPANGSLLWNGDGSFTYTPIAGFSGADSFDYAAFDGSLQSATVTVSITVDAVNDAPTAIDLSNAALDENTDTTAAYAVGALSTTDPDAGDTHVYSVVGGADMLRFSISGSTLMLSDGVLDAESKPLYQVVVRTTDGGGMWFDQAFDVVVNDIDEAPTISAPPDQTMTEGAPTLILPFTVGDPEGAPGSLIVTATSSNELIVQSSSLILGGAGSNRTIDVTPELYAYGTVTITLSVSDGINTTLTAFDVTVTPVADHEVVVDTVSDAADGDTTSIDALLMNRGADGFVSLREAIEAANNGANAGTPDRILFDIAGPGPHFIDVLSQLPAITDSVVIDGTSEPDYAGTPIVEVHGDASGLDGLVLVAGGSTVRGLVIIGFDQSGIVLQGGDNTIAGNYIGIEADGVTAHGAGYGIRVLSNGNMIGGANPDDRNVISGNMIDGLVIEGGSDNVVQGNYIGTDYTGTLAIGNTEDGIWLTNASGNLIGGTGAGAGNVISGNLWSGIAADGLSQDNVIQGNLIGVDAGGGNALGNQRSGVRVESGTGTSIGGSGSAQNVIAYNAQDGVAIVSGTGHSVLENSIYANGGLGIDLLDNGITPNDAGDVDAGVNLGMNFPVIYSVVVAGGNVTVEGEARAGATLRFYESSDPVTGYGEGRTYLSSYAVSGATLGNIDSTARRFSVTFAAGTLAVGDRLTATATDAAGSTSEFARNVVATAVAPGIAVTPVSGLSTTEDGGTASFSVVLLTQPTADVTVNLYSSDTSEGFPLVSSLTFTSVNWNASQTVTIGGLPDGVSDGNVAYTIVLDPAQSQDPAYRLLDPADVSVQNLNGINDAPTALTLSNQTEPEGTDTTGWLVVGYLSTTDPETFDSHTYSIVGGADAAKFSISGSALSMNDGVLDYERQAGYTVTVRTTDIGGLTLDRTFVVSVTNVNDAPTLASNAGASVAWGGSATLGPGALLTSDADNSTVQLEYTVTGLPSVGSLRLSGVALGINGTFSQADIDSGRVTYVHNGASAGPDTFSFTVSDGSVALAPASFNIAVGAAPIIVIVDPGAPPPPSPTDPGASDPGSSPPPPADSGGTPAGPGGAGGPGLAAGDAAGPGGGEAFSGGAELLVDPAQAAAAGNAGLQRSTLRVGYIDAAAMRSQLLTVSLNTFSSASDGAARDAGEPSAALNDFSLSSVVQRPEVTTQSIALTTFRATLGDTEWTTELDRMREDIDAQVPTQSALVVSSVAVTGSLSVGYVLWLLRGGLLLSSLLSSLPAWSVIDPMPVLSRSGHDDEDEGDDPLEKLFGRARAALGLKRGLFSRRSKPIDEVVTPT